MIYCWLNSTWTTEVLGFVLFEKNNVLGLTGSPEVSLLVARPYLGHTP